MYNLLCLPLASLAFLLNITWGRTNSQCGKGSWIRTRAAPATHKLPLPHFDINASGLITLIIASAPLYNPAQLTPLSYVKFLNNKFGDVFLLQSTKHRNLSAIQFHIQVYISRQMWSVPCGTCPVLSRQEKHNTWIFSSSQI